MSTAGQLCIGRAWLESVTWVTLHWVMQLGFKSVPQPHVLKGQQLSKSSQSIRAKLIRISNLETSISQISSMAKFNISRLRKSFTVRSVGNKYFLYNNTSC